MSERAFTLLPFPDGSNPAITISGNVARQNDRLTVQCRVFGQLEEIRLPAKSTHPARKDELWTTTCFEFFLAVPEKPRYWEFNMSPSGDWNAYCMDSYRRIGFREESAIRELPFHVLTEPNCIALEAEVMLSPIVSAAIGLQMGITSVIQTPTGRDTYWALAHPNPQADFHLRESFLIQL